jgi:hypothetical protein
MEKVALLYSGGKDSSLAAYILTKLGFKVKLSTITFGLRDNWRHACDAAMHLGLPHEVIKMELGVLHNACERILKDGYPNNGINNLHLQALRRVARKNKIVGDGTRRDDRVPNLSISDIRSLEDSLGVEYLAPLRGIGYKRINKIAKERIMIKEGASEDFGKGDYESEVRALLMEEGHNVGELFPYHKQSRVIGMRR